MTSNTRFWTPVAARAALGFAAASLGILALTPRANAQTAQGNRAAIEEKFEAWKAGTGNPFDLLADEANWAIGQQASASTYNLHFGNFGGLPVTNRAYAMWDAAVWGSPLILAATFILRKLAGNGVPFAATYWLATAALILAGFFVTKTGKLEKLLRRSQAAALLLSFALVILGYAME